METQPSAPRSHSRGLYSQRAVWLRQAQESRRGAGRSPDTAELPAQQGFGQVLRPWASGSISNMNKMSPRSLLALASVVHCSAQNPAPGKSSGSFAQRMGVWSGEMLRCGEGKGNEGEAGEGLGQWPSKNLRCGRNE